VCTRNVYEVGYLANTVVGGSKMGRKMGVYYSYLQIDTELCIDLSNVRQYDIYLAAS
jgi:hypothetical protein